MLKKWIAHQLRYLYYVFSKNLQNEVYAGRVFFSLSPLISGWTYLPITDWAAGPEYYAHICNDIIINNKLSVVEAGSGISTILLARLIKKNNLKTKILSIDHDAGWQEVVAHCLETDGVKDAVEFVCSPLVRNGQYSWYDKCQIVLPIDFVVDTIVVDGPIGDVPMARYGAIPFLREYLSNECYTIYLHDTDRADEQETIRRWAEMLPKGVVENRGRYSVIQFGSKFCFSPQSLT